MPPLTFHCKFFIAYPNFITRGPVTPVGSTVTDALLLSCDAWVSGQFGAGQFGADNSARTIRRGQFGVGQFGATIRRGQFGANYNINFIANPAFTQRYFFVNPASFSAIFFINLASISPTFVIDPASISVVFFHQSRLHFTNILFINLASISAIFFSSIPLPFQQYPS